MFSRIQLLKISIGLLVAGVLTILSTCALWVGGIVSAQSPYVAGYQAEQFESWSDGALYGNELTLFLQKADGNYAAQRVRLAGIDAPHSTGGGITEQLETASTYALAYITSGQLLRVRIWDVEKFTEGAPFGRSLPPHNQTRLIVSVGVRQQNQKGEPEERDTSLLMLRQGLVWLNCAYRNELSSADVTRYEAAQQEAKANRRGVWLFGMSWAYADCFDRPLRFPLTRPELPMRRPN